MSAYANWSAGVIGVAFVLIGLPQFRSELWRWFSFAKTKSEITWSQLIVVVVIIGFCDLTFLGVRERAHTRQLKTELSQLTADLFTFNDEIQASDPTRSFNTRPDMRSMQDYENKTTAKFHQQFSVRIQTVCDELAERGLLLKDEDRRLCLDPNFRTGFFFSPQMFGTIANKMPLTVDFNRRFLGNFATLVLLSVLSVIILSLMGGILKLNRRSLNDRVAALEHTLAPKDQ